MENNIGTIDRLIRFIAGVVLLIIAFATHLTSGFLSYGTIALGMVLFSTAVLGVCPLYRLLRKRTI